MIKPCQVLLEALSTGNYTESIPLGIDEKTFLHRRNRTNSV